MVIAAFAFAKRGSAKGVSSSTRSLLLLAILTLTQISSAQYFADVDYRKVKPNRFSSNGRDDDDDVSHVDKLTGSSTWWDFMVAHQKDFFQNAGGFGKLKEQWDQVYGLMTKDPERMRENNRQHTKRGAMRSGQGTPEQTFKRERMFEERTRLENIMENKEPVYDIPTSNKLFELWLEKQSDRPGIRQDDKYDLVPHETLYLSAEDVPDQTESSGDEAASDTEISPERSARRILKSSSINGGDELVINKLEEPYPTECYNHGRLAK